LSGFEPQADAFAQLVAGARPNETYLPYAVGDGADHTLHICRSPGMASLLEPDPQSMALFHGFPKWGEVVETRPVATHRLDDIAEIDAVDYLKIDVQGSELAVFQGGRDKLSSAMAVHTEVSFVTLYRNQPTIGDIDLALRSLGFIPHAFVDINRRAIAPITIDNDIYRGLNQLLEADMVYLRDFRDPATLSDEQLKFLAIIAQGCYGSFDLAARCLKTLIGRGTAASGAMPAFLRALNNSGPSH
ncbi:MAG: FkbM family methyltransferase, partial [Hypericibacter sp.]